MILQNPTDKDLTINYKGNEYTLKANGKLSVPPEVGTWWKDRIHNFLIVKEDDKGSQENPFTKEEAKATGVDVDKVQAEAEVLESAPEAAPAEEAPVKKGKK